MHARILEPHTLVQHANIADNEQLVLEYRIKIDFEEDVPFVFNPKNEKRKRKNLKSRLPEHIQEIEDE